MDIIHIKDFITGIEDFITEEGSLATDIVDFVSREETISHF